MHGFVNRDVNCGGRVQFARRCHVKNEAIFLIETMRLMLVACSRMHFAAGTVMTAIWPPESNIVRLAVQPATVTCGKLNIVFGPSGVHSLAA